MNASAEIRFFVNGVFRKAGCVVRRFKNNSANRVALVVAVVVLSVLAGGLLALKSAKARAIEPVGGSNVRADVLDRNLAFDPQTNAAVDIPDLRTHDAAAGNMVTLKEEVPAALGRSKKIHRGNAGQRAFDAYDCSQANGSAWLREISQRCSGPKVAHLPAVPEPE